MRAAKPPFGAYSGDAAMEEMEPPLEQLHETVHHEAHHSQENWITAVALSTALLAALAAIAALLSGYHANTAMIDHIKANDKWSYYQAKNEKATIIQGKIDLLEALDKPIKKSDREKIKEEKDKMAKWSAEATALETDSDEHFERHEKLAQSVTIFQVAVAVCAIAVIVKRKWFWAIGLAFGITATGFLVYGVTFTPSPEKESEAVGEQQPGEKGKDKKEAKEPAGNGTKQPKSEAAAAILHFNFQIKNLIEPGVSQPPEFVA
jgi:hypothetical protein